MVNYSTGMESLRFEDFSGYIYNPTYCDGKETKNFESLIHRSELSFTLRDLEHLH